MGQGNSVEENEKIINTYITRAIVEANLAQVREHESSTCIVKFSMDMDLEDAYTFKNALSMLHTQTEMSPLLYQEDHTFIVMLRDTKIHQAKALMSSIKRNVELTYKLEMHAIGITLLDEEDTFTSLLKRLDSYFVMSKFSSRKKIFYGTKDFDFYESKNDKEILRAIFKKLKKLKIHNLYKGVPVVDKSNIVTYNEGKLIIEVERAKIPFYKKEPFTHLQHDLIPNIIRASIAKADSSASILVLHDLEFLDSSPVERSGVRIEPEQKIHASISYEHKKVLEGRLSNISEGSIVIESSPGQVQRLLQANVGTHFVQTEFQLPTKKNLITTIKTKASVFNVVDEKVILTLHLSPVSKTKIRNYLTMQTESLVTGLKQTLKKA